MKILMVDDERDCCVFFKDYFTRRKHAVDIAYDGLEAKGLLEKNQYDVIFFDCNMPELSGVELVGEINKSNPAARKIMISGYDCIDENFTKNLGVDIFLKKPLSLEDIETIITAAK